MSNQQKSAEPVPPVPQQTPFTVAYKRYGWDATVHFVLDKQGKYRAYVSDYSVTGTPTLTDLSRISTKIDADLTLWVSEVRLIDWANRHAMFFRRWRQQADGTLEVMA